MPKKNVNEALMRHIINDILNGATYSVLKTKLVENNYGLEPCTHCRAEKLIKQSHKIIRDDWKNERDVLRDNQLSRLLDTYTECRELGDKSSAIKALQEINRMTGLYT